MNATLCAVCACLVLSLVFVIKRRIAPEAPVKVSVPERRFAYELTGDERRIVRRLLEDGEEAAAISVISSYFKGEVDPGKCKDMLDFFRS